MAGRIGPIGAPDLVTVLATLLGIGLIVFPEPVTTATGVAILGITWIPAAKPAKKGGK